MKYFLLILFVALTPKPALAEVVKVRSGEHATFSRLVFRFDGEIDWRMDKTGTSAQIYFSKGGFQFDLTDVFHFISKKRLSSISEISDGVKLEISVNCDLSAFLLDSRTLVVDISDAKQREDTGKTTKISPASIDPTGPAFRRSVLHPYGDFSKLSEQPEANQSELPQMASHDESGGRLQRELAEKLGRAASQGLLTTSHKPLKPNTSNDAQVRRQTQEPKTDGGSDTVVPDSTLHSVETAIDRGLRPQESTAETFSGDICLSDSIFDFAIPGGDLPPLSMLAKRRRGLVDESSGKVSSQAVMSLAKSYLRLGFGAEARAVLESYGDNSDASNVLVAVANIFDGEVDAPHPLLADQLACDAPSAMWAALSYDTLPEVDTLNAEAIQRAFSDLPLHMRRHLGPVLSRRFLDAGAQEAAMHIRNSIARAPGAHGQQYDLLDAQFEHSAGRSEEALNKINKIVDAGGPASHTALLRKAELSIELKRPMSREDLEVLDAVVFEMRGTEPGYQLAESAVLARAMAGEFTIALHKTRNLKPADIRSVRSTIIQLLTTKGKDEEFLNLAVAELDDGSASDLTISVRLDAANRFLKLGFPSLAARYVGSDNTTDEATLIRARIELALGDAAKAIQILAPIAGIDADRLRVQAYSKLRAWDDVERVTAGDMPSDAVWKAEKWNALLASESPLRSHFATRRLDRAIRQEEPGPTIAGARHALQTSTDLRSVIGGALTE